MKKELIENQERRVGYNYSITIQTGSSKDRVVMEAQGSSDTFKNAISELKETTKEIVETATTQRKILQEKL